MFSLLARSAAKRAVAPRAFSSVAGAPFKLPDLTYDYGELEPFVRKADARILATATVPLCAVLVFVIHSDCWRNYENSSHKAPSGVYDSQPSSFGSHLT